MALTSVNFSNPFSCPFERSQFTFLANLLFPSIIIATCFGIGPHLITLLQNDLRYEVFLSSLNQDMPRIPFFRDEKNNKKEQKIAPAGRSRIECNLGRVSMRTAFFMIMYDVMTKRKSNAVCRHVTL